MAEPPICALCGSRHWFLEACANGTVDLSRAALAANLDETEKALRFYRAHKARERERQRRKRAQAKG